MAQRVQIQSGEQIQVIAVSTESAKQCAFGDQGALGMRVALVEKDRLGGTCLHQGCIPTKALLQSADVADSVKNAAAFGVAASFVHIDLQAVRAYQDSVVQGLFRGLSGLVASRGITLIEGFGKLTSPEPDGSTHRRWPATDVCCTARPQPGHYGVRRNIGRTLRQRYPEGGVSSVM